MNFFENPECQPLEDVILTIKSDGVNQHVPALSARWVEDRYFLRYVSPRIYRADGSEVPGAKEQWLELVSYITNDLKWLLTLPHYRFWSHIIYKESVMDTIISFLQEAPPFYVLDDFPNVDEMIDSFDELRRLILLIFTRLVTSKEDRRAYMRHSFHGNLLYDNFVLTIPIMLDLSQQYGRDNARTVEKILNAVFKLEPSYYEDLKKSGPFLIQILREVETKFTDRPIESEGEVVPLSERGEASSRMTVSTLEDLIIHLLDVASTLAVFLGNYTPAAAIFFKEDFMDKIVSIYGNTIPKMYKRLDELAYRDETMIEYQRLKHLLDVTRIELLKLYRAITLKVIKDILEKTTSLTETEKQADKYLNALSNALSVKEGAMPESEMKKQIDNYLTIMSNALSEKDFIADYHQLYAIDSDLDVLSQTCPEVDTIKCDFIMRSVYAACDKPKQRPVPVRDIVEAGTSFGIVQDRYEPSTAERGSSSESKEDEKIKVQLASLVSEVKDILCHLGDGYIERCLKHYNYDSAAVINAVLEDTLPSDLKELDPTLPYIPPDPMEASANVDRAIGIQRLNVFDNDEFDVMTRDDIDASRVHKGKRKDKYKNMNELLDDKSHKEQTRDIYAKYNLVVDDYEDEYDDTYESHSVGLSVRDEPVEMDARPFTIPRVLLAGNKSEDYSPDDNNDEHDDEAEDDCAGNTAGDKDCFVRDPAELRAKAEERRSVRGNRRPQPSRNSDVIGRAKGQGQEKSVLANRENKNVHKSSRANHNRRSGAQYKRRQGMVPS